MGVAIPSAAAVNGATAKFAEAKISHSFPLVEFFDNFPLLSCLHFANNLCTNVYATRPTGWMTCLLHTRAQGAPVWIPSLCLK